MSRYIILDRDGTTNKDTGYTYRVEDMDVLPGVVEGLIKFRNAGFKFIIVTNQAGIARKIFTLDDMHNFNTEVLRILKTWNIKIDKIYFCPHHPQFTGVCSCRKPKLGLIELAGKELGLKAVHSIVIGDKDSDIELGKNCGAFTVLIENSQYASTINPDFKAKDINHAFELLKLSNIF